MEDKDKKEKAAAQIAKELDEIKAKAIKEEEEKIKDIVKPPEPPEPPKEPKEPTELEELGLVEADMLEPINLTKLEQKLYASKVTEHNAMNTQFQGIVNQINNILNQVTNENRRLIVESFAENHDIDLTAKKYEFDMETLSFIDYRIVRERMRQQMGNPRLTTVKNR